MAKWTLDPSHSQVEFKVKHLMITNVKGQFNDFSLEVTTDGDDLTTAEVRFSAKTASVNTNNEQRDQHLRSADFFESDKYPEMIFTSKGISRSGDEYKLDGDLTIRNVTKPVTFDVEVSEVMKDPFGNLKSGVSVSGKLNRKEWDLNWNAALETGGVLVSDEVKINAEIQLIKSDS